MNLPSGEQHRLRHREQSAVVTEVGGGLRTYRVGEAEVLDGYAADRMCDGARGHTLLPWPNRVGGGRYTWDGEVQQLPLTEPEHGNAIHGLTRWAAWRLVSRTEAAVRLAHRLLPQPGWPFFLDCSLDYVLGDAGLTVTTSVRNTGPDPCPVAAGAHPYLSPGPGPVDDCELVVPAETYLSVDGAGLPTGQHPVAGSSCDFRTRRRIGAAVLDTAFTDLPAEGGGTTVRLHRPDGRVVSLWAGPEYPFLQVYTGDTLAPGRRRQGLAVEPMTAPPNALQTGHSLLVLPPGEQASFTWGLQLG